MLGISLSNNSNSSHNKSIVFVPNGFKNVIKKIIFLMYGNINCQVTLLCVFYVFIDWQGDHLQESNTQEFVIVMFIYIITYFCQKYLCKFVIIGCNSSEMSDIYFFQMKYENGIKHILLIILLIFQQIKLLVRHLTCSKL